VPHSNGNPERTLSGWIQEWTRDGRIDAVTGYFTVGALAFLWFAVSRPDGGDDE